MTPGSYLHLQGDTVVISVEHKKKMQIPLHHLGSIICFGDVMLTPALLWRCADEGKSVIYLDRNGRFKARMEGSVSGNVLLRKAQFSIVDSDDDSLELAKCFIAGKLQNSRNLLLRGARESRVEDDRQKLSPAIKQLARSIEKLQSASDPGLLRGIEGDAARLYFSVLGLLIKPQFRQYFEMTRRSKRPPKDRLNALLSFLYVLFTNDCRSALESVGLDPQLGFLHVERPGRAGLALDLVEEFRAPFADRLALTLINRGQIKSKDFVEQAGGAVYLNDDGRKKVLESYQKRKQEEIIHPVLDSKTPIGLLPHIQARLLARKIRNDIEFYMPFLGAG
jgi:CRISPR-associated protein Cas1